MNVELIQAFGNDILLPLILGAVVIFYMSKRSKDKDKDE